MSEDQAEALEPSTGSDDERLAELARLAAATQDVQAAMTKVRYDTRKLADPRYCRQCGQLLRETSTLLPQGFDSTTGEPLPDLPHVTRTCSSPSGSMHVTWVLTDDRSGWVRI